MQKMVYGAFGITSLLILGGFLLPSTHRVQADIEIDAAPATVYALVSEWPRIAVWAPWSDSDVGSQHASGRELSAVELTGLNSAAIGSSTHVIETRREYSHVGIVIDAGSASEAKSWFDLRPGVGTTIVSWSLEVDHGFNIVGRYFAGLLGRVTASEYQDGLARLKDLAESLPTADFGALPLETMTIAATPIAYVTSSASAEPDAVAAAMSKAYFRVLRYLDQNDLSAAGSPLLILRDYSGALQVFDAAIPVESVDLDDVRSDAAVKFGKTYGGMVLRASHTGPYANLSETHRKISAYLAATDTQKNGAAWESYVNDPGEVAESDLLTYIYTPIKPNTAFDEELP